MRHRVVVLSLCLLTSAFSGAAAGCSRRAVVVEERAPAASSGGSGVVVVSATATAPVGASSAGGTCGATLSVYDVSVGSGCVIDERVTGAPGYLSYPCGGGPATASFGGSVFSGSVGPSGDVLLEIATGFPFTDGCYWQTKQFIRGNLGSGVLGYEYREEPDPGQRGCASACLGTAYVRVSG